MEKEELMETLHKNHKLIMVILHISMIMVLVAIVYGYTSIFEISLGDVVVACENTCQSNFGTDAVGFYFDGKCMCQSNIQVPVNISG